MSGAASDFGAGALTRERTVTSAGFARMGSTARGEAMNTHSRVEGLRSRGILIDEEVAQYATTCSIATNNITAAREARRWVKSWRPSRLIPTFSLQVETQRVGCKISSVPPHAMGGGLLPRSPLTEVSASRAASVSECTISSR